ncbi:DUF697 domain-containing protein [Eisenibacter elegans]|jgi:uncharacterized protein (DUF697 family)|uniref:DUF697 domain-containing protein n=1 Tax=Eisenibacter elegans TaxID=997 RepID=UPI00040B566C|nr:DUF697 domain-containing protein [Eisenibacter elegans]
MANLSAKADAIIDNHILWSMAAGALPVPLLDMAAITAIQLNMLRELSALYGREYSETFGRNIIGSLTGATLAKVGASLLKTIPGIGSLLGGMPMVVLSGASTYAMGQVFKKQLQVEDIQNTFSMDTAKKVYNEAFETGKDYVKQLRKQVGWDKDEARASQSQANEAQKAFYEKMELLADLHKRGILSDEEYQQKKATLLAQL